MLNGIIFHFPFSIFHLAKWKGSVPFAPRKEKINGKESSRKNQTSN